MIARAGDSLREPPIPGPRGAKNRSLAARAAHSHRRLGISLLEVLVSLTIFLLALVAIGQLVDIGADHALDSQAQAVGTRLCQSKLAEAEAGAVALDATSSGTFEAEPDWQWTVEPSSTNVPNLYAVTVQVSREFRSREFRVSMTQMICDPRYMGQASEAQKPATGTTGGN